MCSIPKFYRTAYVNGPLINSLILILYRIFSLRKIKWLSLKGSKLNLNSIFSSNKMYFPDIVGIFQTSATKDYFNLKKIHINLNIRFNGCIHKMNFD